MYLYIVFHINSVFIHYFTRRKNKNNLREFEPQNSKKFKNIQAEFKNLVSYKKKKVYATKNNCQYALHELTPSTGAVDGYVND